MLLLVFAALVLLCAVGPAVLFMRNLRLYVPPTRSTNGAVGARVAVLIPARNEEDNIALCVQNVLASSSVDLEVIVLDDASTDRTANVVQALAEKDDRVRLVRSAALPAGWNGKQHACSQLAAAAEAPVFLFLDADVRLTPDALPRCLAARENMDVALLSGFPRQTTVSFLEWLMLPLIHFVLLGYLPLKRMRASTTPALSAGCGQFLLVERSAYFASGGHAAIRETRHDGLRLPRGFRKHGFRTDLVDLTDCAEVRMYHSAGTVWQGLAKNATEGMAAPGRIVPFTLLLVLGQVVPFVAALLWLPLVALILALQGMTGSQFDNPRRVLWVTMTILIALGASYGPRFLAVRRFRQPWKSALLHPLGVTLLLAVQWYALARQVAGRPVGWRSRQYASDSGEAV